MRNKLLGLLPIAALVAAGFGITAAAAPADGQAQCSARADIVSQLDNQYGEQPAAFGQVDDQSVVEIFVSETGTWTILVTGTDGGSCILATGEGWDSTNTPTTAALRGA